MLTATITRDFGVSGEADSRESVRGCGEDPWGRPRAGSRAGSLAGEAQSPARPSLVTPGPACVPPQPRSSQSVRHPAPGTGWGRARRRPSATPSPTPAPAARKDPWVCPCPCGLRPAAAPPSPSAGKQPPSPVPSRPQPALRRGPERRRQSGQIWGTAKPHSCGPSQPLPPGAPGVQALGHRSLRGLAPGGR